MSRLLRDGREMKQLICSIRNETEVSASHCLCLHSETDFLFKKNQELIQHVWSGVCGLGKIQASKEKQSIFYQLCFLGCHNECITAS